MTDMLRAIDRAQSLERTYPRGTSADRWSPELPAADRHLIALRLMLAVQEERGQPLTVGDLPAVLAGIKQCGVGLVESLKSEDGVLSIGVGGAALAGGPFTAAVGGVLLLGFGAFTTWAGAEDLNEAWESLDVTAKTAGVCGSAVSAMLTAAGVKPTVNAGKGLTAADLRFDPPEMIDLQTLPRTGRTGGLSLQEQGQVTKPRGGSVELSKAVAPRPVDAQLLTAINGLAEAERPAALAVAERLGYADMNPVDQAVVRDLLGTREPAPGQLGQTREDARVINMLALISQGKQATPEYAAWDVVGAAIIEELAKPLPKSLAVDTVPARPATPSAPAASARIAGTDADVVRAVDNATTPPDNLFQVPADRVIERQPLLLLAVLDNLRLLRALQASTARALFTPDEANALFQRAQAVRPETTASFFSELADVRLVEALREAVAEAQEPGSSATPVGLDATLLRPGQDKVAVRLSVRMSDQSVVDVVVAKGNIDPAEAATYARLGPKGITQNLLTPLVEVVDGPQSLMVTEFVPGLDVPPGLEGYVKLFQATADADYAAAIGALDARIWSRTRDGRGTAPAGQAELPLDNHHGNVNVFEKGGVIEARVIDYAPQHTVAANESLYWVASMLRRANLDDPAMAVANFDGYLKGAFDALAKDLSPAEATQLLRRVSSELRSPQAVDVANDVLYTRVADAIGLDAASVIDAFLARQSPGGFRSLPMAIADSLRVALDSLTARRFAPVPA